MVWIGIDCSGGKYPESTSGGWRFTDPFPYSRTGLTLPSLPDTPFSNFYPFCGFYCYTNSYTYFRV